MSAAGEAILKLLLIGEDKSASTTLGKVGTKAKETGEDVKKHLGGIGAGLSAIGGVAAAAGIVKFGKDSIDSFKEVGSESIKLSRLTGLSVEDASRLRFALKETGVDAEGAGKGLGIFSKNLVGGSADKALADLGIAAKDSSGHVKGMGDLLPGVADKFKDMPNGPEKTALAMKLFGKSGAEMIPFLTKGAEGIKELTDKSDKYGLTITGPMADSLKKARESQKDWNAATEGLSVQFGAVLLPVVTKVIDYVRDQVIPWIQKASGFLGRHGDEIQHVVSAAGPFIAMFATIIAGIKTWTVVQGILNVVLSANPIALVVIGIAALAAGLIYAYQHSEKFREIVDGAFKAIGAAGEWLWNNALQPVIKFIVDGFVNINRGIITVLDALSHIPGFGWAKDAADLMRRATDKAEELGAGIKKIPDKTVTVTMDVTANYSAGAQAALSIARGNTKLALPGFASGGRPPVGQPSLVGENGIELFVPDTAGTVINARNTAALMRGPNGLNMGGGDVQNVYITVQGDSDPHGAAKTIEEKLRLLKMTRGGAQLAFQV
ncbi:MAG: phage tail tape measure protein [Actinobacteria bacterium]|nr:phage tail tape measure protein [Actinomycetota bacterium]